MAKNKVSEAIRSSRKSQTLFGEWDVHSSATNESVRRDCHQKTWKYLFTLPAPSRRPDHSCPQTSQTIRSPEDRRNIFQWFYSTIKWLPDLWTSKIKTHPTVCSEDSETHAIDRFEDTITWFGGFLTETTKSENIEKTKEMDKQIGFIERNRCPQNRWWHRPTRFLRDYYLILLKRWINHSMDEFEFNRKRKKPILEHMKQMKALKQSEDKPADKNKPQIDGKSFTQTIYYHQKCDAEESVWFWVYPSIPTV